jgi:hypothetical protein
MIDQPQGEKPALTVVIQSWWTPAVAVIALVVGLLGGYFGRPLLNKGSETTGDVAVVTSPAATLPADQATVSTTPIDPTMAAISNQQQLMDYLVSHTKHLQGDPNAKVTIIEFSDYQ